MPTSGKKSPKKNSPKRTQKTAPKKSSAKKKSAVSIKPKKSFSIKLGRKSAERIAGLLIPALGRKILARAAAKSNLPSPEKKESVKWLNFLRSPISRNISPTISKNLSTIKDNYGRGVFTGRHLVSLHSEVGISSLESMAKKASLKIASVNSMATDKPGRMERLLKEADGVIFPQANVALLNPQLEDQLAFLTSPSVGRGNFTYAEPERFVYPASPKKNNVQFSDSDSLAWGLLATNVVKSTRTGTGIRLAVLDTGLNFDHPDFKTRKVTRASFIHGEEPTDSLGHGTMCAGIACGIRSITGPRYGVAANIELFAGKVIAKNVEGTDSSLLDGIEWALTNKCRIINLSVVRAIAEGETGFSQTYENLAAKALAANCLIIAAAGNESDREFHVIKPVAEPANCPSVMAVGALDQNIQVANFSCGGLIENGGQVDIAAPGVNILSTHLKSGYLSDSGTSFASPMVAGMAAMLMEENPNASASEIWLKLIQKAKRLNINASDVGAGLAFLP